MKVYEKIILTGMTISLVGEVLRLYCNIKNVIKGDDIND